ncbi:beta-ketoacyl synthase N-terminal-like domain-containing protein [Streptomyces sp. NPDC087901]|uniref:beta-ketoacyl synthase N-terminal-like domain-containing protein n=1 Tax=Streptomyces sp. NPDC087901 TaxID=3365818 RepID=UPI003829E363
MPSDSFDIPHQIPAGTLHPADIRAYVRRTIAEVTGCADQDLSGPDSLRALDMDSLTRMNITLRFDRDLGDIPPTIMFEHTTIDELADFLLKEREDDLRNVISTPQSHTPHITEAVETGEKQREPSSTAPVDGIAVIAVTGRYPGATDLEALWDNLRDGVSSISEVPADRWDWRTHYDERRAQAQKSYGRWGGFIDGVAEFDAEFFRILPRDAANMDPQERLFLETCWHLLEQAGQLGATTHEPSTGIFFGTMNSAYGKLGASQWAQGRLTGPSSAAWSVANRVSYFFDFHGPSFAVDSACSSSLTAIHLACESLRRGECRVAIAGGANLLLHPSHLVGLSMAGMLSSDDACKVFDAAADGFVPGEGVGAVLLKPLADAVADGDRIWAVIRGSAVNTAGRTSGFTVPNPSVQADVVATALARAGLNPRTISYVEAHGTGTELGDPLETAALSRALAAGRPQGQDCAVGSVKANIGHLEGASGIAGLTKVLLQMKHRQIAPCVGLNEVNPKISGKSLVFPRDLMPWQGAVVDGEVTPLRAGVSSFGAGGANAHVVVEEYRPWSPAAEVPLRQAGDHRPCGGEQLVVLTAHSKDSLRRLAVAMALSLTGRPDTAEELERLAFSTQVGVKHLGERLAVVAVDLESLNAALDSFIEEQESPAACVGSVQLAGGGSHVLDDDDGRDFISSLLERRRLTKLARLWADGAPVELAGLWGNRHPGRTDIPPYPFERKRFWAFDSPEETAELSAAVEDRPATKSGRHLMTERDMQLAACGFLLMEPEDVDIDADLMELGFDSISLVQLTAELGEMYGLDIEPVIIFDHPSLAAIAEYLILEHPSEVDTRYVKLTADDLREGAAQ